MRIVASFLACAALHAGAASSPDIAQVERIIVDGTNAFRNDEGRRPVTRNARLEAAARSFAQFMAANEKYGHEADGATPAQRAQAHRYDYCIVSENIAYRYDSRGFITLDLAEEFLEGWKQSPGHRKNMVEPQVTETAVAVAQSAHGNFYAVQMFGRPKSLETHFRVRNASDSSVRYHVGADSYGVAPGSVRTHTICREEPLALEASRGAAAHVVPRNGDDFVIVGDRGHISLRRD
jgi:uncharacterized protein YkwD